MDLHSIIDKFNELTYEKVIQQVEDLDNFDKYIMIYPYKLFVFLVYLILEAGLLLPSKHLNMKLYQYF
jgi:hypothetical protein